jgi:hypothetical protein
MIVIASLASFQYTRKKKCYEFSFYLTCNKYPIHLSLTILIDKIANDYLIKKKYKHELIRKGKTKKTSTVFFIDRHHNDDGHTSSSQGKN